MRPEKCCKRTDPDKVNSTITYQKEDATQITNTFASLGQVMVPREPLGWRSYYILPFSFYLTVFGNKAVGYFFNVFSIFSVSLYSNNYTGVSVEQGALATGMSGLVAGFLAPLVGLAIDHYGFRTLFFVIGCFGGIGGFVLLLLVKSSTAVWIATLCFSILTAMHHHAIVLIPLVVGTSKAGAGYGLYGLIGNLTDALLTILAGAVLGNGNIDNFLLFSVALMLAGILSWLGVYFLERKRSFVDLPLSKIIETSTLSLHVASLMHVIFAPQNTRNETTVAESVSLSESSRAKRQLQSPEEEGEDVEGESN